MKTIIMSLVLMVASFVVIAHKAQAQTEVTDYVTFINEIMTNDIVKLPDSLLQIDQYRLNLALSTARVVMTRWNLKDKFGRAKCALNFPTRNEIRVNRRCWDDIRSNKTLAATFILHEYLGLIEEEVDHYQISKDFHVIADIYLAEKEKRLLARNETRVGKRKYQTPEELKRKEFIDVINKELTRENKISFILLERRPTVTELNKNIHLGKVFYINIRHILNVYFNRDFPFAISAPDEKLGDFLCELLGYDYFLNYNGNSNLDYNDSNRFTIRGSFEAPEIIHQHDQNGRGVITGLYCANTIEAL
jgi:hypothetical protein